MGRDPLIGTMAGNYRLTVRLGAGGMGEVYKAVNEQIGSKVAIKLLHAMALRDKSLQERFLLEAKAVNRIDHPGVVKVIDAGRMESGRPFLVMELLDGDSLHELRKANKLSIAQSCRAMADVLDALAAAHAAGVVHRDLKPANLFRTRDGRTVVLDFGVAKLMASDAPVRLTMTGSAVGTPHYMAPEQIRGMEITPAVDIYAAGVVLFELVCGRRPFDNADEDGVMLGHLEKRPPPPRALEPNVPIAVQDVILAALQKDPAKRPASAVAMRDALRAAMSSLPEVADRGGRSPWARPSAPPAKLIPMTPSSSGVATMPDARIPKTEPQDTPAGVRAHRERASRLRTLVLLGGAALVVAGAAIVVYAMNRSSAETAASSAPPVTKPVEAPRIDAALAIAVDAAPVVAEAPSVTCARLVTVDPIGVADERHAEVQATFFRRCEEDRWTVAAIACFVDATTIPDFARCVDALTPDQRTRLQVALDAPPAPKKRKHPRRERVQDELLQPFPKASPAEPDVFSQARPYTRASVRVTSSPAGASVLIDGIAVGDTPVVVKIDPHTVTVEVRAPGYKPSRVTVDARADRLNVVDAVLATAD